MLIGSHFLCLLFQSSVSPPACTSALGRPNGSLDPAGFLPTRSYWRPTYFTGERSMPTGDCFGSQRCETRRSLQIVRALRIGVTIKPDTVTTGGCQAVCLANSSILRANFPRILSGENGTRRITINIGSFSTTSPVEFRSPFVLAISKTLLGPHSCGDRSESVSPIIAISGRSIFNRRSLAILEPVGTRFDPVYTRLRILSPERFAFSLIIAPEPAAPARLGNRAWPCCTFATSNINSTDLSSSIR